METSIIRKENISPTIKTESMPYLAIRNRSFRLLGKMIKRRESLTRF